MAQLLKKFGTMTSAVMKRLLPPTVNQEEIADAIGYVTNAGAPSAVAADFVGQLLLDTTNSAWYRAISTVAGGWVRLDGQANFKTQGVPVAHTVSATLLAASMLGGLVTVNQGGAAAAVLTTDIGSVIETAHAAALGRALVNGDSFDFSLINISVVAAEVASIAAGATVTLVGDMTVACIAVGDTSSGLFRARRTGANAYSIYRLA